MLTSTVAEPLLLKLDLELLCTSHIKNKVRLDGRDLLTYRPIKVVPSYLKRNSTSKYCSSNSYIYGSSYVSIGNTIVICGINLMIGTPSLLKPSSGDIISEISLFPGCTLNTEQKSKNDLAYELENLLNDILMSSQVIDLEQLCIITGSHAYRLCLKITCLSNDGNLKDAVLLAVFSSLHDLSIPEAIVNDDGIVKINNTNTSKFFLSHIYIPITLGCIDNQYIIDPSNIEEKVLEGQVTVVFASTTTTNNATKTNNSLSELQMIYLHQV